MDRCLLSSELPASGEKSCRLTHLLASNNAPLDSDTLSIRQIICDSQARVDALNARIDALRAKMDKLIAERDRMEECARHHLAVISPVRRVPPELICEIFAATLPWTRRVGENTINSPPWRLAHICRYWRAAAIGDPFLWNSITIARSSDQPPLLDMYPLSMLESQLLRSGNVPLQVTFDSHNCRGAAEHQLLEALLLHCERWGTLNLRCWSHATTHLLLDLLHGVQGRVPRLRKLQMSTPLYTGPVRMNLSIAPSLHEVVLTDSNFKTHSPPVAIPWQQITHYRGTYSPDYQLEILTVAQNLVECRLGFTARFNGTQDTRIITLPSLQRLYVSNGDFLAHVTAPALQHLFSFASVEGSMDAVLGFVRRSACRLTRLLLGHCRSAATLVPLLQHLPFLEYFFLNATSLGPQEVVRFSEAMTVTGCSSDICLNLTALVYGRDTYNELHLPDPVLDMVQSRLQLSAPRRLAVLRIYSFSPHHHFMEGLKRRMAVFADGGLDVAFMSNNEAHALMTMD